MPDIAIRVENLSKLYKIGKAQQRHDTLRDALVDGFWPRITQIARINRKEKIRGNPCNPWQEKDDTIWALKDVSFEVKRGEVVGMIGRKFDEACPERSRRIVAFAEIEKFMDTPVKRYSSGMYVRLAFAVAAHLEILSCQ